MNELQEREKELTTQINDLMETRKEIRQSIAEEQCPFVVGDRLINNKGEKAEVSLIKYISYRENYEIKVKKIKVNGELYVDSMHVYRTESWRKDN